MNYELSNGQHDSTFHDGVALIHEDGGNGTCRFCFDVVLHLHGLQYDNDVAYADLIANLHVDGIDGAG